MYSKLELKKKKTNLRKQKNKIFFFSETTQQEHATRAATHGTGGCECSTKWKAPDDGHKGARNM
jgi:hypothetical protein